MIKALMFLLFPTLILGQLDKDKLSALQVHMMLGKKLAYHN
ncbi:MAG: hypothetical protein CM15mP83_8030 [Flavobacteriaceae bacterium]|nr:MAG: hypothetical protein CM15mP83_8030 [Flavobacteriaceae bacterium]